MSWQLKALEELRGLQDSLDEHVTREEFGKKLRELAQEVHLVAELEMPIMAPLNVPITRDGVREVWDTFVKPDQDSGNPQSVEMRALMGLLRWAYTTLPPTTKEP